MKCFDAKLGENRYVEVFEQNGDVYFGDGENHQYLNFVTLKSQKINSKPL